MPAVCAKRLCQDDAGNQRIAREMTGEDRIVLGEGRCCFRQGARIAPDQLAHENKRRPVGKAEESDVGRVTSDKFLMPAFPRIFLVSRHPSHVNSSSVDEINELPAPADPADADPVAIVIERLIGELRRGDPELPFLRKTLRQNGVEFRPEPVIIPDT